MNEEELHAYVDGALDPARRLNVATYLAAHPWDAARMEAFRAQQEGVRALFDHVLDQPVPERLREIMQRHSIRAALRRFAWALGAVSLMVILALGAHLLYNHRALAGYGNLAPSSAQRQPMGTACPIIPPSFPSRPTPHRAEI